VHPSKILVPVIVLSLLARCPRDLLHSLSLVKMEVTNKSLKKSVCCIVCLVCSACGFRCDYIVACNFFCRQALLEAMGASGSAGPEALAAAEKNASLLTARAGARDPSAIPSICRISAALQCPSGEARSVKGY